MKFKVCGLNDIPSIQQLESDEKVDFIGFIFYSKSARFLTTEIPLEKKKQRVGVFVNEDYAFIQEKIKKYNLDFVQLHGEESAEFCGSLNAEIPVIKAFGVEDSFDFSTLEAYQNYVSYFLFDTKTPAYGGSGKQFSWELLKKYHLETPFFLSGGIHPGSLVEVQQLDIALLFALDLNSGFEIGPGKKDCNQINTFIKQLV